MPYPTNWFPPSKSSAHTELTQMAWRALHLICEHDGMNTTTLAQKLLITGQAAGQLARSLRSKNMIEYVGTKHKRTFKLSAKANSQISCDYE